MVKGEVIPEKEPNVVYITSLFTYAWKPVHRAVKYYKRKFPKAKIVLGGIYASLMPVGPSWSKDVHVWCRLGGTYQISSRVVYVGTQRLVTAESAAIH